MIPIPLIMTFLITLDDIFSLYLLVPANGKLHTLDSWHLTLLGKLACITILSNNYLSRFAENLFQTIVCISEFQIPYLPTQKNKVIFHLFGLGSITEKKPNDSLFLKNVTCPFLDRKCYFTQICVKFLGNPTNEFVFYVIFITTQNFKDRK